MLVVPKSRIHFLQQVCKDRYVAMFMEKESLKRRMRLREITPHEYRALVHAASARSGSGGVRLPTRICARRLARRPCARTALADDQCNACLNRCLRVPLSHFRAFYPRAMRAGAAVSRTSTTRCSTRLGPQSRKATSARARQTSRAAVPLATTRAGFLRRAWGAIRRVA